MVISMELVELVSVVIGLGLCGLAGMGLCALCDYLNGSGSSSNNNYKPSHKDITANHEVDFRQAFIDVNTGKCSGKELNRRLNSGYYNKD